MGVRAWQYHRALRPWESKRNRFEIQYKTSLTPNLIIFVFNAGRGMWAWSRILDLGSTSMAGRVLEKFLREVIGKNMVHPFCVCFLSGDCFAWGDHICEEKSHLVVSWLDAERFVSAESFWPPEQWTYYNATVVYFMWWPGFFCTPGMKLINIFFYRDRWNTALSTAWPWSRWTMVMEVI